LNFFVSPYFLSSYVGKNFTTSNSSPFASKSLKWSTTSTSTLVAILKVLQPILMCHNYTGNCAIINHYSSPVDWKKKAYWVEGSKSTRALKWPTSLNVYYLYMFLFHSFQQCTDNVHFRGWVILEPYAISTSKFYN